MTSNASPDFQEMVRQVQIAHRLVVGYYQRLLPAVKDIANDVGFSFWKWKPSFTDRPGRGDSDPAGKWAWDMVPLYDAELYYWRIDGGPAKVGDLCLGFWIRTDASFGAVDWTPFGLSNNEEPDAVALPIGDGQVHIYLARCIKSSGQETFPQLWGQAGDIDETLPQERWQAISGHLEGLYLTLPLADFLAQPKVVAGKVAALIG